MATTPIDPETEIADSLEQMVAFLGNYRTVDGVIDLAERAVLDPTGSPGGASLIVLFASPAALTILRSLRQSS